MRYRKSWKVRKKEKEQANQKIWSDYLKTEKEFELDMLAVKESLDGKESSAKISILKNTAKNYKFRNRIPYKNRRQFHDKYKYQWFKEWHVCFICCVKPVEHIHHMTMLINGGTNDESNLVGLCENCHCGIHEWMAPTR